MILSIIGYVVLGGLAAIGLATIVSYFQYRSKMSGGPVKYARIRLEWESKCVTYKTVPYNSDKMLDTLLALASTISMRGETEGEGKRLVQDKVKAVTVVHNNWPAPTADETN
jgi:hypothetical protein